MPSLQKTNNSLTELPLEGFAQALATVYAEVYASCRSRDRDNKSAVGARWEAADAVKDFAALLHVEVGS